ncbi:glycosyltransferase [Fodinibius salsisoli]|uniref:Glycosyltransferase family 2 protein n=1 Tax=Fodinibius salsisoli TaxID=2820877 RepID=A0ABT3PRP4_9BACT|nr:glycosyltransferase [Fodinibius salsisoli]MCW9708534.1 glycosyltransferase family 2 protein [Fodinibius salsisoli]
MSHRPDVTFIICTYNRAHYLDDSLQSLQKQDLEELPAEILVVDNNSTDATPQIIERHQKRYAKDPNPIRYIKETNQGLSHARNRGIREAQAPCIVFLDDDIRASESLIPAWLSFFCNQPQAIAGGGKIHVQFDDPRPSWMSHFLLPLLGHHDLGDKPKTYPQNKYPFGGNMGFRKSIFDQLGLFHTDLGRTGKKLKASEEKELFQRFRKHDINLHYLPDAMLYHRVNDDRLTEEYIQRQAVGLGQSIALQLHDNPNQKVSQLMKELGKWSATLLLFVGYLVAFQPAKAVMLIKFRKWIAEGYLSSS